MYMSMCHRLHVTVKCILIKRRGCHCFVKASDPHAKTTNSQEINRSDNWVCLRGGGKAKGRSGTLWEAWALKTDHRIRTGQSEGINPAGRQITCVWESFRQVQMSDVPGCGLKSVVLTLVLSDKTWYWEDDYSCRAGRLWRWSSSSPVDESS